MVVHLGAFIALSALIIVMPGQDTALTIRNTLVGGRRAGVLTGLGVGTGQTVWVLATSAGLAVLLQASHPLFVALRLAGAAYLVWLGVQALRDAAHGRGAPPVAGAPASVHSFRQGLLSNIGNPKMAVFFTSLLPQFARGGFLALLLLGGILVVMTVGWLALYACAIEKARSLLSRTRIRRALDALTGAVLVAFGLRLAAER
jgi:threonine/homoserine/homoserine lactone efflux protein